ncbi:KIN17-like protein [Daucus carota subsp. sativus]|uniref:KIN17-like protein n=1 Tax=Daucus carota subsp. sativus TaxID=79200 RepID=UPI00308343FF
MKAKGLQKLKYYCQMCRKSFRDENGFKCHCLSDGHVRQMELFGQNPNGIIESFSEEFEASFLECVRRRCRGGSVAANVVYNEIVSDRHHVHMNATRWSTLHEFVRYLGRSGKCRVEERREGWFVGCVDRGSGRKRVRVDEEREEWGVRRQIERACEEVRVDQVGVEEQFKVLRRDRGDNRKVKIRITKNVDNVKRKEGLRVMVIEEDGIESKGAKLEECSDGALGELMREQEEAKERRRRKDYWLCEGIVVKVMSKALAEKGYYKQKGVVRKVIDKYVAEIEMIEKKHLLRVDQEELETVIPQVGAIVRIVNGAYCGSNAKLLAVDTSEFCAKVQIEKGLYGGRVLPAIEYEDICKIL